MPVIYTDATLNFMTGCTKVSPGCKNCWAESFHNRFHGGKNPVGQFKKPFSEIQLFHDKLDKRIPGGKPKTYFVNNTSDMFHPKVPGDFAITTLGLLTTELRHRFLILTKRPDRMAEIVEAYERHQPGRLKKCDIWFGTTICNQPEADKNIIHLLKTPAVNRWLSIEPLLSEIDLELALREGGENGPLFSWVVIGCESGKNRRPCKLDHVYSLVDQCQNAGVKVFVKQLDLDGKCVHDIDNFPKDLQVRELPWTVTPQSQGADE